MNLFDKVTDYETLKPMFFDGMTLLFGGFGGVGTPPGLVDCLIETGVKDVKLIGNDAGIANRRVWMCLRYHPNAKLETIPPAASPP